MEQIQQYLEYTILKANTSISDVRKLCEVAVEHRFAGVCVPPLFVREAKRIVGDEGKIKVATVVGFPMGYSALAAKTEEIKRAIDEGADEIDGVVNIAAIIYCILM